VLKGCFVFMADLMRNVDIRCTMDFMPFPLTVRHDDHPAP
jgi:hypoxanthine-guanine phosphoribosyltransferase